MEELFSSSARGSPHLPAKPHNTNTIPSLGKLSRNGRVLQIGGRSPRCFGSKISAGGWPILVDVSWPLCGIPTLLNSWWGVWTIGPAEWGGQFRGSQELERLLLRWVSTWIAADEGELGKGPLPPSKKQEDREGGQNLRGPSVMHDQLSGSWTPWRCIRSNRLSRNFSRLVSTV